MGLGMGVLYSPQLSESEKKPRPNIHTHTSIEKRGLNFRSLLTPETSESSESSERLSEVRRLLKFNPCYSMLVWVQIFGAV